MDDQPLVMRKLCGECRDPLAADLVGMSADVESENASGRQRMPYRIDGGMCRERRCGRTQCCLECAAMIGDRRQRPGIAHCGQCREACQ